MPDVKLTRSKDGSSGTATFVFDAPSVFESSEELGDITGLFMIDDEGEFATVDVQAKFVNGKPDRIECRYVMRSAFEWDRFMRFMERYAEKQGLGFQKVSHYFDCSWRQMQNAFLHGPLCGSIAVCLRSTASPGSCCTFHFMQCHAMQSK